MMQKIPVRLWFVLLPLATGGGLVVYILTKISLPLTVAGVFLAGVFLAIMVWRKTPEKHRPEIKHRALVGAGAGIVAIVVYDASRLALVKVFGFTFWPFDILRIFGQALVGVNASLITKNIAGILFHCANGIGFGVAFVFLWQRSTLWAGILWGLILECCMVSLYPGWLHIKFMEEFLSVSIVGHIAYGLTLGGIAQRYLLQKGGKSL